MAKPLDSRVIAVAKLGDVRLSLNLKLANPDPEIATPTWCQMATIDYALEDATGGNLGQRTLTHQTAGVEVKPTLAQAIAAVSGELRAWIRADRLAIADDES